MQLTVTSYWTQGAATLTDHVEGKEEIALKMNRLPQLLQQVPRLLAMPSAT
jgi:hypothetical protein